jgi:hypothetical protein
VLVVEDDGRLANVVGTLVLAYAMGLSALACPIIRLINIVHFNGGGYFTYTVCMVPV